MRSKADHAAIDQYITSYGASNPTKHSAIYYEERYPQPSLEIIPHGQQSENSNRHVGIQMNENQLEDHTGMMAKVPNHYQTNDLTQRRRKGKNNHS